jgi:putative transposase
MIRDPADYGWSSYRVNALGTESELCTPHEICCAPGDDADRLAAYRALFAAHIDDEPISDIREATRLAINASSANGGPYRHVIAGG